MRDELGVTQVAPGKAVSAKLIRPEVPQATVTLTLGEQHAKYLKSLLGLVRTNTKIGQLSMEIYSALAATVPGYLTPLQVFDAESHNRRVYGLRIGDAL